MVLLGGLTSQGADHHVFTGGPSTSQMFRCPNLVPAKYEGTDRPVLESKLSTSRVFGCLNLVPAGIQWRSCPDIQICGLSGTYGWTVHKTNASNHFDLVLLLILKVRTVRVLCADCPQVRTSEYSSLFIVEIDDQTSQPSCGPSVVFRRTARLRTAGLTGVSDRSNAESEYN